MRAATIVVANFKEKRMRCSCLFKIEFMITDQLIKGTALSVSAKVVFSAACFDYKKSKLTTKYFSSVRIHRAQERQSNSQTQHY